MKLTIVMYHYVRKLRHSRFPAIKGLETDAFGEQIAYLKKQHNVISGADLLAAAAARAWDTLPPSPLLLTFDDGYLDHFTEVFPILCREGLSACFFPPAMCVVERRVLDVNKIHFVLAAVSEPQVIVDQICRTLGEYNAQFGGRSVDYYWTTLAVPSRFDAKEIVFIKRMLQRELPEGLRRIVLDGLFRQYVTADEAAFANELYMSLDQIACMRDSGMYIGSHGHGHYWMDRLDRTRQAQELVLAREFLRRVGTDVDGWIMSYPYGAYNESLLSLLGEAGCRLGLTTRVGTAELGEGDLLTLPRLDTNDVARRDHVPMSAAALPHAAKV